jgi:AraC-like DNA-binding protein
MLIAISFLSILLSLITIIYNWKINRNSLYIGAFLLFLSLYSITHYYTIVEFSLFWSTLLYNNFSPLYLLMGPLLFFYIRGVFKDQFIFSKKDLLHFIPAIIHLIAISKYLILPFSQKKEIIAYCSQHYEALNQFPFNSFFNWETNYIIRISSLFGYLLLNIIIVTKEVIKYQKEKKTARGRYIFRWIYLLLFLIAIILGSYSYFLSNYMQSQSYLESSDSQYTLSISVLGIALINISLLMFPEILYGKLRFESVPSVYKKSIKRVLLKEEEVYENEYFINLTKQINDYFVNQQPYLKPEFAISDLTIALKVPQHHITICYRDYIGIRFTDMKIDYRVEYAKKELLNPINKNLTLEAIGFQSGFLSKSNFFSCFKKITGTTPLDYQNNS